LKAERENLPVEKKALNTRYSSGNTWKTNKKPTIRAMMIHFGSKNHFWCFINGEIERVGERIADNSFVAMRSLLYISKLLCEMEKQLAVTS